MTGIQRQCCACKAWKAPVHFRLRLRKGVRFTKGCAACRGRVRGAWAIGGAA